MGDLGGLVTIVTTPAKPWPEEQPDRNDQVDDDRNENDGQERFLGRHGRMTPDVTDDFEWTE